MAAKTKKGVSPTYEALALMSRLFYEKFGDDAVPMIKDVWYKLGLVTGERLKEKLSSFDFKSAATLIITENLKNNSEKARWRISNEQFYIKTPFNCDVGLDNTDSTICHACMAINQGQFKSMCGNDVKMDIIQSRAAGDDCCEIIYTLVEVA
jgi:predicted hydrocarbon binding protein